MVSVYERRKRTARWEGRSWGVNRRGIQLHPLAVYALCTNDVRLYFGRNTKIIPQETISKWGSSSLIPSREFCKKSIGVVKVYHRRQNWVLDFFSSWTHMEEYKGDCSGKGGPFSLLMLLLLLCRWWRRMRLFLSFFFCCCWTVVETKVLKGGFHAWTGVLFCVS